MNNTFINYKNNEGSLICEASFNRLLHWIENYEIAMITAFRGRKENILHPNLTKNDDKLEGDRYNRRENKERNRELAATLLRLGYGITKISGVYVENFGMPNSRLSEEESFLVVNKNDDADFYKNIFKLSEYYNQDCFCYKAKGDDIGYNVGTNGADYPGYGEESRNGKFVAGVKNEFMSRLKNNGFAFTDEDDLDRFTTSHDERKRERNNRRLENGLNEQFETFNDYGMGAKQSIHNISKEVIKHLKK